MRWILGFSMLLAATAAGSSAERARVDRSYLWTSEEAMGRVLPEQFLTSPAGGPEYGYDVDHYDLDIEVTFDPDGISGTGTLDVTITQADLTELLVDLTTVLTVDAVTVDGLAEDYVHEGERITISLDAPPSMGSQLEIAVTYHGLPVIVGNKGFKFRPHGQDDVAYAISTPYSVVTETVIPVSRSWRPCKDVPTDKSTSSMSITSPDDMIGCSNGLMTGDVDNGDGTRTVTWEHGFPVAPYLITIGVSNYVTIEDTYVGDGGSADIQHFVYPEKLAQAQNDWTIVVPALTELASLFGEYPFIGEKFGMFSIYPDPAVEEQTMVAIPANLITGTHQYDYLVVHEMAHMWWGDCVTCAGWENVWLNEGFASYAEALWFESLGGFTALRDYMIDMDGGPYQGTLYDPPWIWNAIVYNKGAWVLHMLRRVTGDDDFFRILQDYRTAHEFGTADTEDFVAAAETVYGGDLGWFFDPWVYEEGRPVYSYSWDYSGAGPYTVGLTIAQVQPFDAPTYTMPIDVTVTTAGLAEESFVVWDSSRVQSFEFVVPDEPVSLALDPDRWILAEFNESPTAAPEAHAAGLVLAQNAPNPFGRGTKIRFGLAAQDRVTLRVFDSGGRLVRTLLRGAVPPGFHTIVWDGRNEQGREAASGIYHYRLETREGSAARRMLLAH